jgi:Tfp pilus assembly protein FimT
LLNLHSILGVSLVFRRDEGYSLIDILVVIAIVSVVAGMAIPGLSNVTERLKLGTATRDVERELQTARLKAVTSNRPIRVRFNCPSAGYYRMVELIGTPGTPATEDSATNRCQETAYKSPANDSNPLTRPNHDGPLRKLPDTVTFGSVFTLEFWPDGSVHKQAGTENPWLPVGYGTTSTVSLTLVKGTEIKRIDVNNLGKITLVQ